MKILVCGGRNYGHVVRTKPTTTEGSEEIQQRIEEYKFIHATLNKLACEHSINHSETDNWLPTDITIISGRATGVDNAAADYAVVHFCKLEEYLADWAKHGKAAGPIRNQHMLDHCKPDLVVAFPGGRGTADMVARARKAGVKVLEVVA